jgi:3-hydroxymyristoyl/3-hydroxydecanoyl-(acyl carrier protein) dehydratase
MSERIDLIVAADHPAFAGHFPDRPIVPGALLIDLAIRAVEQATGRDVASVAQAKFLSPAVPGETLALVFEPNGEAVRFDIETGDRKLASGRFTLRAIPA